MTAKKIKKRVSNGISSLHGNKEPKGGQKTEANAPKNAPKTEALEQKIAENPSAQPAALIITVTRHHYPALKSMIGSHAFISTDGRELRNLLDLAYAFEEMSEEAFRHHVGETHNHFSNWLRDCFELTHLAESIKGASREEAHAKILKQVLRGLIQ